MLAAVIFDLDGVLLDSEELWDQARRDVVRRNGGTWLSGSTEATQGMSSTEWSSYLHDRLGVPLPPQQISNEVVDKLMHLYEDHLPLLPGGPEAVRRMAARWPLGLASSSNRAVIDVVLEHAKLAQFFRVTLSSEEVARGKPAPDVYLEAARRLRVNPSRCAVIEDSANGIRAGVAAGMRVVAIPNPHFPPPDDVLTLATVVLPTIEELTPEVIDSEESSPG